MGLFTWLKANKARRNIKRIGSYVSHPPRYYLNLLTISMVIAIFALLFLLYLGLNWTGSQENVLMALGGILAHIQLYATLLGFVTYQDAASTSSIGIFGRYGVHTMNKFTVSSELIPVVDDSENKMKRLTTFWRDGPLDGAEQWWKSFGGGDGGYHCEAQSHIRETYDLQEDEWHIVEAWSLGFGYLVQDGNDRYGKKNEYTFNDIVAIFNSDKPYTPRADATYDFPWDYRARVAMRLGSADENIVGAPPYEVLEHIKKHKKYKETSPIIIGWDLSPAYGGPGMNLPSRAEERFWKNESVIGEQSTAITDQRVDKVVHEKVMLAGRRKEYEEWLKTMR